VSEPHRQTQHRCLAVASAPRRLLRGNLNSLRLRSLVFKRRAALGRHKRRLALAPAWAFLLALGGAAAFFIAGGSASAQPGETTSATDTTTPAATTTTVPTSGTDVRPEYSGSTWVFIALMAGLALFVAVPYVIDVIRTHRRWDDLLEAAKEKEGGFSVEDLRAFTVEKPNGVEGLARALMAFVVIGILGAALFYVLVETPTENSGTIISNLLSTLGTLATAIIAFYFGTRAAESAYGAKGEKPSTDAPTNSSPPTIGGTPNLGQTLTANPGEWTGSPTAFDYQWERKDPPGTWNPIPPAKGQSYQITQDDVGHSLRVAVTATNSAGKSKAVPSEPKPITK
jgi:type II secretory pathway pseudopilin PulG